MRLLHKCDLFRVVQDKENHLTPATPYGAAVSIVTTVLLVVLLLGEVHGYFSGHKNCHITPSAFKNTLEEDARRQVDTIHYAITLPYLPCHRITTETMTGYGHDRDAEKDARIKYFHIPYASTIANTSAEYLPGALPSESLRGCFIRGTTPLSNAHASFNVIIKDYVVQDSMKLHPDFVVNEFYIGNQYSDWGVPQIRRRTLQPLAGFRAHYELSAPYLFQFYLQLIQTTVDRPGKDDRFGYQYTAYYSMLRYGGAGRAPGLYFAYQPSSYSMDCEVSYDTVSHFTVNLCAVAGGVYTVAGIVEAGLEWLARRRRLREASAHSKRNAEALMKGPAEK
ncbi:hypothetical protein ABB37_09548 [Leptomonas pyrrhocoris]|uniref:Endoplasmic reticulum vesicle transporter C-terminal domain-containing protein n=1 Tax=Leptomonas pyrrhocoris TaxID=157538 RepID=A0A0M9FQP8_LEPPY|nr:hypothetical protein ABB37_09548 [Leptomonas pyrrhocoris]KPA73969.1 hypothetical protein ABB37_09548 [Leptomonas pyrrhocoris]|eukprot:XP_015652408.1 hypothetical protein ABB37_09548 [Leptomonas pyrrhocoris]